MDIVDIPVKCQRCGAKFTSQQVLTMLDTGLRNSELRHTPPPADPPVPSFEHYAVITCPSCGKVDWSNTFAVIDEPVSLRQASAVSHLQFRMAAIEAERQGQDWYHIGMFYLYAAWCADDALALPQAREYRVHAGEALRKSILDGSCPPSQRSMLDYLIGEVLRRSGQFQECQEYFKEVIPRLLAQYAYMARKLMRLADNGEFAAVPFDASAGG